MQMLYILRGCLAAYIVGVLLAGVGSMIVDGDDASVILIVAIFGSFLAIPLSLVALAIWGALVYMNVILRWWIAPTVLGGFGLIFTLISFLNQPSADGLLLALILFVGGAMLLGCVFWLGAFGRAPAMRMAVAMPKDT